MKSEERSLPCPDDSQEGELYSAYIIIERTDNTDHMPSLNLTELCTSVGQLLPFPLTQASSRRWRTLGLIKLPARTKGIDCFIKCEGEEFSSVHLNRALLCTTFEEGDQKRMKVREPWIDLTISWSFCLLSELMQHTRDPDYWGHIGGQLVKLFQVTGDPEHITEAIAILRRAIQLTPGDYPRLYHLLYMLGVALMHHFRFTGDLPDITEAISVEQEALKRIPEGHVVRTAALDTLGLSFTCRYERTFALSDIDSAISSLSDAVRLTPIHSHDLGRMRTNLGDVLKRRFLHTGHPSDIDHSISVLHGALEHTAAGDSSLPSTLSTLGESFGWRAHQSGNLLDIAQAILTFQRAVSLSPQDGPGLPRIFTNLGGSLAHRFERTGDLSDITEAISAHQRAVTVACKGDRMIPLLLNNISLCLNRRFRCTGNFSDISEAVSTGRDAVNLALAQRSPDLYTFLLNLGDVLGTRFVEDGRHSDIAEAISVHRRALKLTPDGHADLPAVLHQLGCSLLHRFQSTANLSDIDEGISAMQRAVELTPCGHSSLTGLLSSLGRAFVIRSDRTGSSEDMKDGILKFKMAATNKFSPPRDRLHAAAYWAQDLITYNRQSPDILLAFDTALGLLSMIGGLEQTVRGRHTQLKDVSGITLDAAAVACHLYYPVKALEWLEQGRCLVWNQIHQLRAPLDELHLNSPKLAQHIAEVAQQLENVGSSHEDSSFDMPLPQKIALQEGASARIKLSQEWEELLHQARAIPGMELFLQPPKCSALLQNLPASGVVVVISTHEIRCTAIALLPRQSDNPKVLQIDLPLFSEQKARDHQRSLAIQLQSRDLRMRRADVEANGGLSGRGMGQYRATRDTAMSPVRNVLRGLWVEVVKPVLDILALPKFDPSSGREPPRIWWCPTGALSFLPIHAAGIYGGLKPESILDYAVSSYTPTVSALGERVRNGCPIDDKISGLFLTSQPNVPGTSKIPGTTREVRSIYEKVTGHAIRVLKVEGSDLTVGGCLDHLENFSSIHLACHGYQDAVESLKSRFYFHNGTLDLATILRKNLKNADLAFLSACMTGTGDESLSDEVVHLAAGMLAAGYRRVVASVWCIQDNTAQVVANDFYDWLFSHRRVDSREGFDGSLSAYALHHAIQKLRDDRGDTDDAILAWAPFVHFGY